MYIYLGRHLQPKVDGIRKKDPSDKLTSTAHKKAFSIASLFNKAKIEWVITSEFCRSEMCGTATADQLRIDRKNLIVSELVNELEIPSIWGQEYTSTTMQSYLAWRSKIFSNPNTVNFASPFPLDPKAESFLNLCQRQDRLLNWLSSFQGNKIVWGHSQAIEAMLYRICTGLPNKIDPVDFIRQYEVYFPKKYGDFATLHLDESSNQWSVLTHGTQIPFIPK
jgi:hypothetical protein